MSEPVERNDKTWVEAPGPIAWMARNGVATNLLMFGMLAVGIISTGALVQEGFPTLNYDAVEVLVAYPGATPDEVEEGIVLRIEEQVASLEGVNEVTSVAAEGLASVIVSLRSGTNVTRAADRVESAVNTIRTFPARAERPVVQAMASRQSVIRLAIYGEVSERTLKELAYRAEDEIAELPDVSFVETSGVRPYEVAIEGSLHRLRSLGLTLDDLSDAVRRGSLDLSAGRIATVDSNVRVRTVGKSYSQQDFEEIIVLARGDGAVVRVRDIATVRYGLADRDLIARYNGQPAAFVEVFRSAGEQVIAVADAVEAYVEEQLRWSLPEGTAAVVLHDDASVFQARRNLLLQNGVMGLLLVFIALALFLRIRVAAWVVVGMASSFVAALAVAALLDVTLNTTTLTGFLIGVGIVVDDAVVVAENVHSERMQGRSGLVAAVLGTRRVVRPLIFAVLTTVVAFGTILMVPGPVGAVVSGTAIILISVLVLSLVEALFVLPHHLATLPDPRQPPANRVERFFTSLQDGVDRMLHRFKEGPLDGALRWSTRQPAVAIALCVAAVVLSVGIVLAGWVDVGFLPAVESDGVVARLEMPEGTPAPMTDRVAREVESAARRAIGNLQTPLAEGGEALLLGVTRTVGLTPRRFGGASPVQEASLNPPSHVATIELQLAPAGHRDVSPAAVAQAWSEETAGLIETGNLTISTDALDFGPPVVVELSHPDPDRLPPASESLVRELQSLQGVFDVQTDIGAPLPELQIELRPEARTLGLTLDDVARQVRSAFFGSESLRLQRGREDVAVNVRLAPEERDSIGDVERYMVRVPGGAAAPLSRVAEVRLGGSPPTISRRDGRRVVTVTADVDSTSMTANEVNSILASTILPELANAHPGLFHAFGGEQRQQAETQGALLRAFAVALLLIYGLLAVPLNSYLRPLIIMAVIPLGLIGTVLGHMIVGIGLSAGSVLGVLGLSGVVVNDSLMIVDFIDRRRRGGEPLRRAIVEGAKARFRPIFVTSLTTFVGFAPLILGGSAQAQILIPLAVAIGFGLLFATGFLMVMVPALVAVSFRDGRRDDPELAAAAAGG